MYTECVCGGEKDGGHSVAWVIERNAQRKKSRTVQTGDLWRFSPDGRKWKGRVSSSGSG